MRKHGCRHHYRRSETRQSQRVLREVHQCAKQVIGKIVETIGQRAEHPAPSWTVNSEQTLSLIERAHHHAGTSAVDGVS